MKRIAIAAAAALLMLGTAQAQQVRSGASPLYGELGYTFLNFESGGIDADPHALRGIVGYDFHPFFAAEGMLAVGTRSDDGLKLRSAIGVFAKPKFNFNNLEVFGRLGWFRAKVRQAGFGSDTDDDFAYGVGLNYHFNPRTYVGADWMRYFDKRNANIDGLTISVGFRF
jgi:hypothetical protein